jgi:hypothetical protein
MPDLLQIHLEYSGNIMRSTLAKDRQLQIGSESQRRHSGTINQGCCFCGNPEHHP